MASAISELSKIIPIICHQVDLRVVMPFYPDFTSGPAGPNLKWGLDPGVDLDLS